MKRTLTSILVLLLVGMISGVTYAQGLQQQLTAAIPFDFVVGNTSLPAGDYYVQAGTVHGLILIQSFTGKANAFTGTIPSYDMKIADASLLQFRRYGDTYFLSKIVVAGKSTASVVLKSKREREVALASARSSMATVQAAEAAIKR